MSFRIFIHRTLLSIAIGLGGLGLLSPRLTHAALTNVNVGDNFFSPKDIAINVNDQVKWTWTGSKSHSSTGPGTTPLWDSGVQGNGWTFTSTFPSAGNFSYRCTVHAPQTGTVTVQTPANVAPTVTLTNPPSGAILSAPASFTLMATAADTDGSVTNVQFFQGAASLGNATSSPYSVPVNNLAAGNYTFSAVASDNGGLKATNAISVTVNALPSVAIFAPTNGATFAAPWTGVIQATANDTDGTVSKVDFFAGINPLGSVTNPPVNFSLPVTSLPAGNYNLSAMATDNRGGTTASVAVPIKVVTPVTTLLSAPQRTSPTSFKFSYSANVGLSYVIFRSANLINWSPINTNAAGSNPVVFVDLSASGSPGFYRVQRLPNP